MEFEALNPADELRRVIADGTVSEDALAAMTGIRAVAVRWFLDEARPGMFAGTPPLSLDEGARLSILAAHLTEGLRIGDDDRLGAIVEGLTIDCHLSVDNVARLTGSSVEDIEAALRDPGSLSIEAKYRLATRGSYLINAVNQARGRY